MEKQRAEKSGVKVLQWRSSIVSRQQELLGSKDLRYLPVANTNRSPEIEFGLQD
jgi:hypothetical protein